MSSPMYFFVRQNYSYDTIRNKQSGPIAQIGNIAQMGNVVPN